jgi:signal transduction histidine kinase
VPATLDSAILSELLGLLAHDLRNPLSALHSNLGFLSSVVANADIDSREAVSDGLVSCDGLAHIIDNIDLLGQAMGEGDWSEGSLFEVDSLVEDVVAACQPMADSHKVTIELVTRGDTPTSGHGPRDLVARALSNLIRNSIQHSPSGRIVRVSIREGGAGALVLVEDAGTPLSGAVRASSFTAPGQVGAKTVPNGRYSRGLGLYCAALAAAAAQAAVRVVDPPSGSGNAFELDISRR